MPWNKKGAEKYAQLHAKENTAPQDAAIEFNHWHLSQVTQNITPDYTSIVMQKYVTTATPGKLHRVNNRSDIRANRFMTPIFSLSRNISVMTVEKYSRSVR